MGKPTLVTGIEKFYIAMLTNDETTGLSYGTPKYYKGVQEFNIKPKYNQDPLYGEGQIEDIGSAFQQTDVDISRTSLTSAERAELLGQSTIATGGISASGQDESPFVAALYKAKIPGGYRYGVIYKGMFKAPDEDMKQQEGKIAYSIPKLSAIFIQTRWSYINSQGKENHPWEYHIDTTDPNCPADIDSTWFMSVTIPTVDTVAPTVTSVPANNATAVAVTADGVLTFSKAIDVNTVTTGNVFLMTAAGVTVATTLSVNTLNTVVTIHPTANLTALTDYLIVVTKDVKSAFGVSLAANNVFKFKTA